MTYTASALTGLGAASTGNWLSTAGSAFVIIYTFGDIVANCDPTNYSELPQPRHPLCPDSESFKIWQSCHQGDGYAVRHLRRAPL